MPPKILVAIMKKMIRRPEARLTGSLPRNSNGRAEIILSISIYQRVNGEIHLDMANNLTSRSFLSLAVILGLRTFFFGTPDSSLLVPDRAEPLVVLPTVVTSASVISVMAVLSARSSAAAAEASSACFLSASAAAIAFSSGASLDLYGFYRSC